MAQALLDPNEICFSAYEKGEGYRPKLIVTYTSVAPTENTDAASNIAGTTARLNSTLVDDGGEPCEIRWGWGESSESAIEDYDHHTEFSGAYSTGEHPYYDVDSLDLSTTYYFRVEAQNSEDTDLGDELSFATTASPDDPTDLRAYPSSVSVSLTWAKGAGAANSIVRYRVDTYPTTYTDGFLVYDGTSASCTHTGLKVGTVYYYAVWGYSGAFYSSGSAEAMTTTFAAEAAADEISLTPDTPTRMYGEPNYTNLSNLPIVYDIVNNFSDSISMPRETAWLLIAIFSSLGFGVFIYLITKGKLLIALIALILVFAWWWAVEIVAWWILGLALISTVAIGFVGHRENR